MNVHHFTGLLSGGAATAATQLHRGLLRQGIQSRLYYPARAKTDPVPPESMPADWSSRGIRGLADYARFRAHRIAFKRLLRGRPRGNEIFTSPRGAPHTAWPTRYDRLSDDEILHLHWVAKFIDYRSFFGSLPQEQPVVWTLHDMNAFTGGCHFAVDCQRFREGCGHCPQLPRGGAADVSEQFFQIKRQALAHTNLHVVAASRWMLRQAQASPIFENARSFQRIPYGLPLSQYQPVDRRMARQQLGLEPDAFVFSFGAVDLENRRKGAALLMQSLRHLADVPQTQGLVLGGGELPIVSTPLPPLRAMGFVKETQRRALIFSACDAFVLPSTEDNMPLTGLEAMACGTPVIAFDAGGIPDFVRPAMTGMLARKGDADELGRHLRYASRHREESAKWGSEARRVVETEYQDVREANDYIDLYRGLCTV